MDSTLFKRSAYKCSRSRSAGAFYDTSTTTTTWTLTKPNRTSYTTKPKAKPSNYPNRPSHSSNESTPLPWSPNRSTKPQCSTCSAVPRAFLSKNLRRKTSTFKGFYQPGPCMPSQTTSNATEVSSTQGMRMAWRLCSRKSGRKRLIMICLNSRNAKYSLY